MIEKYIALKYYGEIIAWIVFGLWILFLIVWAMFWEWKEKHK